MHVRIAWEIYHHQAKQNPEKSITPGIGVKPNDMLRPPTHIYPPGGILTRPHDMQSSYPPTGMSIRPSYDASQLPASFLGGPTNHMGTFFLSSFFFIINL